MRIHPTIDAPNMLQGYFNYASYIADGYWDRRSFVRHWWKVYCGDSRWTPPHFPTLQTMLVRERSQHIARMRPQFVHVEAMPDTRRKDNKAPASPSGALFETTIGAAVLLCDPRRQDRTAYLALLHCVNNSEALKRFIGVAIEKAGRLGCHRLVGPTGLSPHIQTGLLQDHFNLTPPLHTPYNPPYAPEVMQAALYTRASSHLYHFDVLANTPVRADVGGPAQMVQLDTRAGWKSTLIPLFPKVFDAVADTPIPDEAEAEFLVDWVSVWPLTVWLALIDDEPAGYIMLQPDLASAVIRARGGRNHLWRPWLAWRSHRRFKSGRLLFGGVRPEYRGRGVGNQLLQQAILTAAASGWETLTIGPLPFALKATAFLTAKGAERRQSYRLYATEI